MLIKDLSLMAEIIQSKPITQYILKVILKPQHYVPYQAGQYLQILTAEGALSFSIANAPLGARHYELHIKHNPANIFHKQLMQEMREIGELPIFLPLGNCHIEKLSLEKPIIMLAQGTGFAPIKAILEQWLAEGKLPPTLFCWLANKKSDYYMKSLVERWDSEVENFRFLPLEEEPDLSKIEKSSEKSILKQVLQHSGFDLNNIQVVLSGPFARMLALKQEGISLGMKADQFFSDALEG